MSGFKIKNEDEDNNGSGSGSNDDCGGGRVRKNKRREAEETGGVSGANSGLLWLTPTAHAVDLGEPGNQEVEDGGKFRNSGTPEQDSRQRVP